MLQHRGAHSIVVLTKDLLENEYQKTDNKIEHDSNKKLDF